MYIDFHVLDCENSTALGMENGEISNGQITASSVWATGSRHHGAANGRLNFMSSNIRTGAWSSGANDLNQWLQVDFQRSTIITGISTQGRQDNSQRVTKYTIFFGDGKNPFYGYKSGKMLKVMRINFIKKFRI